jgi:hypothetical protein
MGRVAWGAWRGGAWRGARGVERATRRALDADSPSGCVSFRIRLARAPSVRGMAPHGRRRPLQLQAVFSASLSLHALSRSALLHGSRSPCLASFPVMLCRTLRAMMVGDPRDHVRSSRLPLSPPAVDSGLFLVASHNLASPRALASGDHDAPGLRAGVDLGATWP